MKRIIACILVGILTTGLCACAAEKSSTANEGEAAGQISEERENKEENSGENGDMSQKKDYKVSYDGIKTGDVSSSGVAVHDPSILEADGAYYIYGSHMTAAKSTDLLNWKMIGDDYKKTNPVYGQVYDVFDEAFRYSGASSSIIKTDDEKTHVWAPDVIYNKAMGKYCMYYCMSSTFNASNLCFGISDSPEGPFEWQGALIYSGFSVKTLGDTDVLDYVDEDYAKKNYIKGGGYNYEDYPNAIDPTIFYDKDGKMWMVYGSWSGGIFLLEIDEETGLVIHPEADPERNVDAYFGRKLLGGGHISIEGPYITYDDKTDYYYLYVSYGGLTSNGGYQMRVFRSKEVDGDYVDMNGQYPEKSAMHENFGLKLSGNYKLPSLEKAYMATGHNSAFRDNDGKSYVVYHTRFNDNGENHSPRVHQIFYNKEGWPCELPYQTQGETISENGYEKDELTGRYYVLNQGSDISSDIANPKIMYLNDDGTLDGREAKGNWEAEDGSCYMTVTIDGTTYNGVFCKMLDEAGTEVMTFSAVGNNTTVWGVKYME